MNSTYQVTCSGCGQEKWPVLPERPLKYTCALCRAVGAAKVAQRKEAGQRGAQVRKSRPRKPGEPPGGQT